MRSTFQLLVTVGLGCGATLLATSPATADLLRSTGPINLVASEPPDYSNCTLCHSDFALNSGDGSLVVTGIPCEYTPGQVYGLTITLEDPGQNRWGFELTVVDENAQAIGTLTTTDAGTQLSSQLGKIFLKHNIAGTRQGVLNGPVQWAANWTAPAAGSGTAFFFATGNAANNDVLTNGDYIYNFSEASGEAGHGAAASLVLQPNSTRVNKGGTLDIRVRVKNHLNANQTLFFVSRVKNPSFPASGFLLNPIRFDLGPCESGSVLISHPIPNGIPSLSPTYEGFVGTTGPKTLVDAESFDFFVQ